MQKHQKSIFWAIIVSEASHVFCCVLPTIFSILSLLSGFGIMASMPGWLSSLHELMHERELFMIGFSVLVIALGWGLYFYSKNSDCHDQGCCHADCRPRKKFSSRILIAATVLLAFNLFVYFVFHQHQEDIEAYIQERESVSGQ